MSKKLLIAVLIGLLFTFVGSAVAGNVVNKDRVVRQTTNTSAPEYGLDGAQVVPNHLQRFGRPPGTDVFTRLSAPVVLAPIPRICDTIGYAVNQTYFTRIPSSTRQMLGQKFSRGPKTGTYATCSLKVAYIAYYPGGNIGTPDMVVQAWDDDGFGYPGALKATVTIPYASLPLVDAYVAVNFPAPCPTFNGDYFVTLTTSNPLSTANQIATLTDDGSAGACRGYVKQTNWYSRCELGFLDYNYDFIVDQCCIDPAFSDCVYINYSGACDYTAAMGIPRGDGTRSHLAMRFTADQPDTLKAMHYYILDDSWNTGTPNLVGTAWGNIGGLPDMSNIIYSGTLLNGDMIWDGSDYNTIVVPSGVIVSGDFHVGMTATGGSMALLGDDGSCGTLRSSNYNPVTGLWTTMMARYGLDRNFDIGVSLCKDMYSECKTVTKASCTPYYAYSLPSNGGTGRIGAFQRIDAAGVGSKLGKVRVALNVSVAACTNSEPGEVRVYSNDGVGGAPGTLLGAIAVNGPYVDFPALTQVDFSSMNIRFDGWVYVGFVSLKANTGPGSADVYAQGDDDACDGGGGWIYYKTGAWVDYTPTNFLNEADICSVPVPERSCTPGESWPTAGHDFRRTAASQNATGDAKCKQQLMWAHINETAGAVYNAPTIYDTVLIIPYSTKIQAYSINGNPTTPMWTISGLPYIGGGGSMRNTLTAKDGYVYFGGGNANAFTKADVYTGAVVWSRNPLTGALNGNTMYNSSVIIGTTIYTTTETGGVYALDVATGANVPTFNGGLPVILDGEPYATLSSNGTDRIYVGTDGAATTGYGTLYAIDAATGAIVWSMGEAQLQGHVLDGDVAGNVTTEIFQAPIAVDANGTLFVTTSFNSEVDGAPSGAKYAISSAGTILWAKGFKFGRFAGPIIDANYVYMPTLRGWTSEATRTEAVNKASGAIVWQSDTLFDGMSWSEGALSCEPGGVPDILYLGNQAGRFLGINTSNGTVDFEYAYLANGVVPVSPYTRSGGVAIDASHVVMLTRTGDFFVLQTGMTDRPRLRVLKTNELQSVPFFSPNGFIVTYPDVFMNNGCANLTGTLSASSTPAAIVTSVNPDRITRMGNVADNMVANSYADMAGRVVKSLPVEKSTLETDFASSPLSKDTYSNTAAYAPPSWLNSIAVSSFDLAPGASFSVQYDVNGPLVTRGPHYCYVTINSNDKYYLNSNNGPVVQLGVLGGCMKAEGVLTYGLTSQNSGPVYNTGELQNQLSVQFGESGTTGHYFQGWMFFAMSKYRIAFTGDNWNGGENFWNTLLPDVNVCGNCEPTITQSPIHLVDMSTDGGATYAAVNGYVSTVTYIDSVINYDCHGTWNWYTGRDCPFVNDSTMGLKINQWMYGIVGQPAPLNNLVIYRMDIQNRNNRTLNGVHMGQVNDYDLQSGAADVMMLDVANNVARSYSCNTTGTNKLVMGVGGIDHPIVNTRSASGNGFMYITSGGGIDSVYNWASTLNGETHEAGVDFAYPCAPGAGDRENFVTLMRHNFAPNETYTTGNFWYQFNSADPGDVAFYASMATLVKQLCGFGRGDINADGSINLADVVALQNMVNGTGNGPKFKHLADVNNTGGAPDMADVLYLANYWFCSGPAPMGGWVLPTAICP